MRVNITVCPGQVVLSPIALAVATMIAVVLLSTNAQATVAQIFNNRPVKITFLGPMRSIRAPLGPPINSAINALQASNKPPKVVVNPRMSCR